MPDYSNSGRMSFDERAFATLQYMYQKPAQENHAGKYLIMTSGSMAALHGISRQHARNVLERMVRVGQLEREFVKEHGKLGLVMYHPTADVDIEMKSQLEMI